MRWTERGQALPLVLAAWAILLTVVFVFFQLGRAHLAAARAQTLADLAAVSAARTLPGVTVPLARSDAHAARVRSAAADALGGSGSQLRDVTLVVSSGVPIAVDVEVRIPGPMGTTASAVARAGPALTSVVSQGDRPATYATGGGYAGLLVYRDGKPTCPAVAAAFDLMQAAAATRGLDLHITSAFRSDREQAELFARNPDPKWVAPPGRSRHRDATELDLRTGGGAYEWLSENAGRFGFVQRYSWEPWHWGYRPGCGGGLAVAGGAPRSGANRPGPLPAWVPARYHELIRRSADSAGIPPVLLSALLRQESGFRADAVSPVGALGIAQFMPATAAAVGLSDPRDPGQAVPAAARHLADLIRRLGGVELGLAAYNAGEGAVRRYGGIPPFPETRAYVRAIVSVAGGAVLAPEGDDVVLMPLDERLTVNEALVA